MTWSKLLSGFGRSRTKVPTRLQFQTTECGVAVLAMMLAYLGKHVPMEEIRHVSGVSRDCMNAADMVRAARHFGVTAKAYSREPEALYGMKFPFVAHMRFIHFVVVEGMTATHMQVNDPAVGRWQIPLEQFDQRFTGVVVSFTPTAEFRRSRPAIGPLTGYWRRVRSASWKIPFALGGALICGATLSIPIVALADAAGELVDHPATSAGGFVALLLAATAARAVIASLLDSTLSRLQSTLASTQAKATVARLLALPYSYFAYRLPARLHATIHASSAASQALCQHVLPIIVRLPAVAVLLAASWRTNHTVGTVLLMLCVLFASALAVLFRWRSGDDRMAGGEADKDFSTLTNSVENIESIKLAGEDEDFIVCGMGNSASKHSYLQRAGMSRVAMGTARRVVSLAVPLAVLLFGAAGWQAGLLTPGSWLTLFLLGGSLVLELQRWPTLHRKIDALRLSLLHVADVFDYPLPKSLPAQIDPCRGDGTLAPGAVRMRDVVFGYAAMKPPLVAGLNLNIGPGEQIGITGPSGSGKSTLGGLLSGLHQPFSGEVEVGVGETAPPASSRRNRQTVAWVDRTSFFFEGTVRDNLCLWQADFDEASVRAAVRDACIDDVLALRPGELDAPVEARGRNFSGGQRQRLEIARALMRNPAVLVLDEATDALDPELEARIRENIRKRDCTLIIISHRVSTLAACERVVRIEHGTIMADASPAVTIELASATSGGARSPGQPCAIDDIIQLAGQSDIEAPDAAELSPSRLHALVDAFTRVAKALGQSVSLPLQASCAESAQLTPTLTALARHNGMYLRRVRLVEKNQWRMDHGPLIAVTRSKGQPVAALPEGGHYRLLGDDDGASELSADTLHQLAFCLYPRADLSDGSGNSPINWLRRGLVVAGADLRRAIVTGAGLWLFAVLPPLLAMLLLDQASAHALPLVKLGLSLLALLLAAGLIEYSRELALLRFDSRLESTLMADLYQRVVRLAPAFVRGKAPEHLARSLAGFSRLLDQLRGEPMRQLLDGGVVLTSLGVLALLDMKIALVALLLLAPALVLPALIASVASPRRQQYFEERVRARRFLFDALHGAARLRLLKADRAAMARWLNEHATELKLEQDIRRVDGFRQVFVDVYPWLAGGLWIALLAGPLATETPVLLGATLALWAALTSTLGLGEAAAAWMQARDFIRHAADITRAPLEAQGIAPAPHPAVIELVMACFQYPGTRSPALQDISLRIEPGQLVVLAGPSGGGKSTLLRLLLGFDAPQSGDILHAGTSFRELDIARWRQHVGAVMQNERIGIASTLRSQISGLAPFGLGEIWRCAELARLGDDIRAMPMGMQTIVEGNKISTGQEQRLLIAARLIRRPSVLVLDEATNAISDQAQAELIGNLRGLGITCILVTHRESAIALADQVHVLEGGRVVWSGAPKDLNSQSRLLARMRAERNTEDGAP